MSRQNTRLRCLLSKPSPYPVFLMDNIKMDTISTKIKWEIHVLAFYIVFQVLKVATSLWKFVRYSHQIFYFLLFLLAFTSADIIFHTFLELHSILSEKDIRHEFSCFKGFIQNSYLSSARVSVMTPHND